MKKLLKTLLIVSLSGFAATLVMYWFNLDNKVIYYGVRPFLTRLYDRQKRDVRL